MSRRQLDSRAQITQPAQILRGGAESRTYCSTESFFPLFCSVELRRTH